MELASRRRGRREQRSAMADRFGRTEVRSEFCSLTWRIDKFSMHAAKKKAIASPVFDSNLHAIRWRVELHFSKHNPTADVILKRVESDDNEQFLNIKLSIIGRSLIPYRSRNCDVVLGQSIQMMKLGTINLEYLTGGEFHLGKLWLLPKDTLTLRCEMVVSEDGEVVTYKSREEYESYLDKHGSPKNWYDDVPKYIFPLLFFLPTLVAGVLSVAGFYSTFTFFVACLVFSFFCFMILFWDPLYSHLERLAFSHLPIIQTVDEMSMTSASASVSPVKSQLNRTSSSSTEVYKNQRVPQGLYKTNAGYMGYALK